MSHKKREKMNKAVTLKGRKRRDRRKERRRKMTKSK